MMGTDAFQELDVFAMTLPMVKHSFIARSVDDLPTMVAEAFRLARSGRPGPVLTDLPGRADGRCRAPAAHASLGRDPREPPRTPPCTKRWRWSRKRSGRSSTAAAGSCWARPAGVPHLRRRHPDPTGADPEGLGALPTAHPLNPGMLGMHGSRAANGVQEADLLIVVGARFR